MLNFPLADLKTPRRTTGCVNYVDLGMFYSILITMSEEHVHLLRKIQKCSSATDRNEIVIVFLKLGECVRLELS